MNLTNTSIAIKGWVWNSNDSSQLVSAGTSGTNSIITLNGDGTVNETPLLMMGPQATTSTFTFTTSNTAGGTGMVKLALAASGAFNVENAGATLAVNSPISENATSLSIEKTGNGMLILGNTSNSFTGGVILTGGTLSVSAITPFGPAPANPNPTSIVLNGGTLRYTGNGAVASSNRGVTINAAGGTIDVQSTTGSLNFAGEVAGSGAFQSRRGNAGGCVHLRIGAVGAQREYEHPAEQRNVGVARWVTDHRIGRQTRSDHRRSDHRLRDHFADRRDSIVARHRKQ